MIMLGKLSIQSLAVVTHLPLQAAQHRPSVIGSALRPPSHPLGSVAIGPLQIEQVTGMSLPSSIVRAQNRPTLAGGGSTPARAGEHCPPVVSLPGLTCAPEVLPQLSPSHRPSTGLVGRLGRVL